jgi:PAS domain S-box-containing protein
MPLERESGVQETALHTPAAIERARADAALPESERGYRSPFEPMDEGFAICEIIRDEQGHSIDYRYLEINPPLEKRGGVSQTGVAGLRASEAPAPPDAWLIETFGRVVDANESVRVEHYFPEIERWYDINAFPRVGDRFAVLWRDVTDRKQIEEGLTERDAWLRGQREALEAALNGAPLETSLGILVRTATERLGEEARAAFYAANDEGTALYHVVGMSSDYAKAVDGFRIGPESLACGLATHTGLPVLTTDVTKEPLWAPWLGMAEKFDYRGCWSFPIHTAAGQFVGTFAMYFRQPRAASSRDLEFAELVTQTAAIIIVRHTDAEERRRAEEALRESEQNLRAVANIVPDLLWYSAPDGTIQWCNDRWMEYTGQSPDQAAGWGWTEVIYSEDRESAARRYREAVEQGRALHQEHRMRRYDGEYRWFLVRAEPLPDESGRIVRMYGSATDIHEQRSARTDLEQEVAARTAELEMRVTERDALLKEVHHRVKNNLHVIMSMLEMQARRVDDVTAMRQLQEVCNRVTSIAQIHELLYQSSSLSAVDLTAYARQLLPRVVAFYRMEERIKIAVYGDCVAVGLEQAVPCGLLLNELVSNACKHAFPQGRQGRVEVHVVRQNGRIQLAVEDNGTGLPPGPALSNFNSLGLKIVELLTAQLHGTVDFQNLGGAAIEIQFPYSGV